MHGVGPDGYTDRRTGKQTVLIVMHPTTFNSETTLRCRRRGGMGGGAAADDELGGRQKEKGRDIDGKRERGRKV